MKLRRAISDILESALHGDALDGCDYPMCQRFSTYSVEIHSHFGWQRCDDHAKSFDEVPTLYEHAHADAVRKLEKVGLTRATSGEEIVAALLKKEGAR